MLPALLLVGCAHRPVTLHIAAINDFHGALYETPLKDEPGRAHGGLPWLVGALNALRADDPDLVVLDGGDLFQGAWAVNKSFGRAAVDSFELMGVDAGAVGNHEFDYGPGDVPNGGLVAALEAAAVATSHQWLTANVSTATGERWAPEGITPWVILRRKGVRLGIIGLTTEHTPQTTKGSNVVDLRFGDVVEAVRDVLPVLHDQGVAAVIVVGHLSGKCDPTGFSAAPPDCVPDGEIGRLLTELPPGSIDLIVAGHAHTFLATRVGDTFVVENRDKGRVIGLVDLVIGKEGVDADKTQLRHWELIHDKVDPGCEAGEYSLAPRDVGGREVTPSAAALELVRRYEKEAGTLCSAVGCADSPLGRSREGESGVGDLVADAMLAAFPGADVALTNSGGLRDDLRAGTVRRQDLQQIMPFDNRLVMVEMTGKQLLLLLRLGTSGGHGLLQVSGLSLSFDPTSEAGDDLDADGAVAEWERDRLCSAVVAGNPIDEKKTYQVVTTDFLFNGGDHLELAFAHCNTPIEGPLLRDWLFDWFPTLPGCVGATPLPDPLAPRISATPGCVHR